MTDRIPTQDITDAAQKKAAALRAAKGRKEEKKQDAESLYQKRHEIQTSRAVARHLAPLLTGAMQRFA